MTAYGDPELLRVFRGIATLIDAALAAVDELEKYREVIEAAKAYRKSDKSGRGEFGRPALERLIAAAMALKEERDAQ